ncbi:CLIP-associating protein [Tieghemostelium lacteum]|uniref:CLIP-associating protein n=1 Tax=Tieghemostelium lacteum TaxID=361077 RepID=A0A152A7F7_TIELA|nr:CLIP-associating protein [Tieghemostelium lacteum]|eukprot:KYR01987.1 CLIP-associating protein [Tieghemostelium lacteum]
MGKKVNIDEILGHISSDDFNTIQDGYKNLINSMKAGKVKIDNEILAEISNIVIKHLNEQGTNEKIRDTVLEVSNFLIDFIFGHENEKEIINSILSSIFNKYIGSEDQACRDQIQSIINTIIPPFGFERVLNFLQTDQRENLHNSEQIIEHKLSIVANLIDASVVPVREMKPLFKRLLIDNLKRSNTVIQLTLQNCISSIYKDMGQEFLVEVQYQQLDSTLQEKLENITSQVVISSSPPLSSTSTSTSSRSTRTTTKAASASNTSNTSTTSSTSNTSPPMLGQKKSNIPIGIQLQINSLDKHILETRMTEIINTMNDSEAEWKIKLNNLLIFQLMVDANATKLDNFIPLFQQLKESLAATVNDKRSQVVKEVCQIISNVVQHLQTDFEPFFERFTDALVKNLVITVKVVSESSDLCIKNCIKYAKSPKIINKCLDILESEKSAVLRSKACEYLYLVLSDLQQHQLEKYLEQIEKIITIGVRDASPISRSFSRQSFIIFSKYWNQKSIQLLQSFDPSTQKSIQKDMAASSPSTTTTTTTTAPKSRFVFVKPQTQQPPPSSSSSGFVIPLDENDSHQEETESPNLTSQQQSSSSSSSQQTQPQQHNFSLFNNSNNSNSNSSIFKSSSSSNKPPTPTTKSNINNSFSSFIGSDRESHHQHEPQINLSFDNHFSNISNHSKKASLPDLKPCKNLSNPSSSPNTSITLNEKKRPASSLLKENEKKKLNSPKTSTVAITSNLITKSTKTVIPLQLPLKSNVGIPKRVPIVSAPITSTLVAGGGNGGYQNENENIVNIMPLPSHGNNILKQHITSSAAVNTSTTASKPTTTAPSCSTKDMTPKRVLVPSPSANTTNIVATVSTTKPSATKAMLISKTTEKLVNKTTSNTTAATTPSIPKTNITNKTTIINKPPLMSANSRAKNYVKDLIMNQKLNANIKKSSSSSTTTTTTTVTKTIRPTSTSSTKPTSELRLSDLK